MNTKKLRRALSYLGTHMTRFLLLAVVLTTALSSRQVAEAKYASYLNDYTSAVAGNFYFASDYLGSLEAEKRYDISGWDTKNYPVTLQIKNYEDALRFNGADTDVFYYVTATVYDDADGDGYLTDADPQNNAFTVTVNLDSANVKATKRIRVNGEYVYRQYALLPGCETFEEAKTGIQQVNVEIKSLTPANNTQFLVVEAKTVPLNDIDGLTFTNGYTKSDYTTTRGVYETTLRTVFALNIGDSSVTVRDELIQSESDYTVTYKLICETMVGGTSAKVKVYFKPDRITPDERLGQVYGAETDEFRYIETPVTAGSIKNLYFFKNNLSDDIVEGEAGDIYFVLENETEEGGGEGEGGETGETGGETGETGGTGTEGAENPEQQPE